jgi:hypothetical protein
LFVVDLLSEAVCKDHIQVFVEYSHIAEAKCEVDVLAKLNQINDGQEYSVEAVGDDVLTEEAGRSNGHGVAVDHAEALLEDGVLTLGRQDLLLVVVPLEVGQEVGISNETGSKVNTRM